MSMKNFAAWNKKPFGLRTFPSLPTDTNVGLWQSGRIHVLNHLSTAEGPALTWKVAMLISLNLQEFDSIATT